MAPPCGWKIERREGSSQPKVETLATFLQTKVTHPHSGAVLEGSKGDVIPCLRDALVRCARVRAEIAAVALGAVSDCAWIVAQYDLDLGVAQVTICARPYHQSAGFGPN